ncbi:MAG: peptidylprolyl isomerase [Planctomycetales bacterium]|nr:peptidylprolyl isomerase [bacterium]UNM09409.1 MAG: peptidylprolyl isomerase [Planctomycetales bacterium]
MSRFAMMLAVLALLPAMALANGYDTYSAPIAWSPDSHELCVVQGYDWPQPQVANEGSVLVYDQYGRIQYDLGTWDAGSPAYSPDGKYLAVIANGQAQLFLRDGYEPLAPVDLEGSGLDLAFVGQPGEYELAYSVGPRFYGASLVIQQPEGGNETELPKPLPGDSAISLRMCPTDWRMAFLLQSTADNGPAYERIYGFDDNGEPYQLTRPQLRPDDYHESNICFMPDGSLLFQRGGWGDWHIFRLDPASGRETLVVPDAQQPSVSADGRLIAFTRRSYADKQKVEYDWEIPPGVWVRDLATGQEWRISDNENEAEHPVISPDGRKLAWLQRMETEPRLMVRSVIGFTGVLEKLEQDADDDTVMYEDIQMDEPLIDDEQDPELGGIDSTAEHLSPKAMEISYVKFECTNGDIIFAVHHEWNPLAAERFITLVNSGYYDGAPWFRVIDGFVAQCGISADPRMNAEWDEATFPDEEVLVGNTRGMVAYGKTGDPDSRTTHIYINYGDNSRLDEKGFSAFAEVWQGMDVADSLFRCEYDDQEGLAAEGGLAKFREMFPEADFIELAYVMEGDPPAYQPVLEPESME